MTPLFLEYGYSSARSDISQDHIYFDQIDVDGIRDVKLLRPAFDGQTRALNAKVRSNIAAKAAAKLKTKVEAALAPKIKLNIPLILPEVLNLPRLPETGPIGGCSKIHKGHTESGGFFVFTCEKLRPEISIAQHEIIAHRYRVLLREAGWVRVESVKPKTTTHKKTGKKGCKLTVNVTIWDDRVMGEPVIDRSDRNTYRQIVFLTSFKGKSCEPYYATIKTLAQVKQK